MSRLKLEERYGYYRRCQRFRKNGEQCKAPAMKGDSLCHQHAQEAELELRRRTMRQSFVLPPLRDLRTVQSQLGEVTKAIIEDRIDEDYAVELLAQLEKAAAVLRGDIAVIGKARALTTKDTKEHKVRTGQTPTPIWDDLG